MIAGLEVEDAEMKSPSLKRQYQLDGATTNIETGRRKEKP